MLDTAFFKGNTGHFQPKLSHNEMKSGGSLFEKDALVYLVLD